MYKSLNIFICLFIGLFCQILNAPVFSEEFNVDKVFVGGFEKELWSYYYIDDKNNLS